MTYSLNNQRLADFLNRPVQIPVSEILANDRVIPKQPGFYAWWFLKPPEQVPLKGTHKFERFWLLYIGIAPSRRQTNARRVRTLRDRIKNHCHGPIASSTLRRSLAALLTPSELDLSPAISNGKLKLNSDEEASLTNWLKSHAAVSCYECDKPWIAERFLLSRYYLPLNLQGTTHEFRKDLKLLRKNFRENLSHMPES